KRGVPIFLGSVQDGSIFLNAVKLKRLFPETFKFEIDINDDVYQMAAVQHFARHHGSKRLAIWILGGGVPKNYTLQGEPLLDQILGVPTHGFDIDVQFCVDPVDNGALSSCPAGEGHTWGKVSAESVATGSMYVHCDVTAVFPWLTYALLSDARVHDRLGPGADPREERGARRGPHRPPRAAPADDRRPARGGAVHAQGRLGHTGDPHDRRLVPSSRARAERARARLHRADEDRRG